VDCGLWTVLAPPLNVAVSLVRRVTHALAPIVAAAASPSSSCYAAAAAAAAIAAIAASAASAPTASVALFTVRWSAIVAGPALALTLARLVARALRVAVGPFAASLPVVPASFPFAAALVATALSFWSALLLVGLACPLCRWPGVGTAAPFVRPFLASARRMAPVVARSLATSALPPAVRLRPLILRLGL
jgi:hypothetical protein